MIALRLNDGTARRLVIFLSAAALVGCSTRHGRPRIRDAGPMFDAGSGLDASELDAGPLEAGPLDGGRDAGSLDAGRDGGRDAGRLDGGRDGGRDAGRLDAGRDAGRVDAGPGTLVTFPSVGDTWSVSGEHVWEMGAYVQGTRSVGLASTVRVEAHMVFDYNSLSCDNQDMRMLINGAEVGRFSIAPSATVGDHVFTFARITGPTFTLRYENVREVAGGCGSARFDKTLSTLRFYP